MAATISVKEAVQNAFDYIRDLIPKNQLKNLMLEEVEFHQSRNEWLITVGYDSFHDIEKIDPTSIFVGQRVIKERKRVYKIIRINASNGSVISMKIRSDA